ncbi:hypothetical protein O6H91_06G034200 [Diphasiastrum complanatum]|uniref:Uncharacterized protein n=1 Tax=Diphasiastrum complanatum TaxID=34168 RepID=A0ACC2DC98_DIPCM|nr:hypothetical protein O6H91_Y462400 [Diphasiastrum complanatum]KAJ7551910.1 hypothetical protein O6H91_06G034200 [Diphasiastrum complanatum]
MMPMGWAQKKLELALLVICLIVTSCSLCGLKKVEAFGSRRMLLQACPCEEFYVVRAGETLHSVSAKCNAPFILIDNPQIQDGDDIEEGSIVKLDCSQD